MNQNTGNTKKIYEEAYKLFETGNFRDSGKLLRQILKFDSKNGIKDQAREMLNKLSVDRIQLIIGLSALCLLIGLYAGFAF